MKTLMLISATIRRFATEKDEYGNQIRGEPEDTETKCWISPKKPGIDAENEKDRNQSKNSWTLIFYGNYDIMSTDQIIVAESYSDTGETLTLEVYGEPMKYRDRQGRIRHIEVVCEKVTG